MIIYKYYLSKLQPNKKNMYFIIDYYWGVTVSMLSNFNEIVKKKWILLIAKIFGNIIFYV